MKWLLISIFMLSGCATTTLTEQARVIRLSDNEYVISAKSAQFKAILKEEGKEFEFDSKSPSLFEDIIKMFATVTMAKD